MTVDELYESYLTNVKDFVAGKDADETVMRGIEEPYGIPEQSAYDFRFNFVMYEARGLDPRANPGFLKVLQKLVGEIFDN